MLTATINEKELLILLEKGKQRAESRRKPVLVSLSSKLDGSSDALEFFLNDFPDKTRAMFWSKPGSGFWMAGTGVAATLSAGGADRFQSIKEQTVNILDSAVVESPEVYGTGPVFMGGFRFDTMVKRDDTWHDFPDALMTLPRFVFTSCEPDSWLTVNAMVEPGMDILPLAEVIKDDLELLKCPRIKDDEQPPVYQLAQSGMVDWNNRIKQAMVTIQSGDLVKVVLSRRKVLHARGKFSLDATLQRLITQYPECVVFAVNQGNTAFVGASPEDLACLEDGKLSVSCLASSAARGNDDENDFRLQNELFLSPKERAEHAAVTSVVGMKFQDLCTESRHDLEPRAMKLKNIQHMLTSFTGSLKSGIDILDVVARLHPTPAVAGLPVERGIAIINELEGDRGWYAAPVGWYDAKGEGEFAVGIRSALIDGNSAYLFAGCGIVAGSEPSREFEETELKFRPMLNALGGSQNAF